MSNCSSLESLGDFDGYLSLIRSETNYDPAALAKCQRQICVAIFGEGNPDISGIGVSIGYGLEVALGFVLMTAILAIHWLIQKRETARRLVARDVLYAAMNAFFNCAIYFALAVEAASLVMLLKKDFGISTKAFGSHDAQITFANSVVCILPLLYPLVLACSRRTAPRPNRQNPDGPPGERRGRAPAFPSTAEGSLMELIDTAPTSTTGHLEPPPSAPELDTRRGLYLGLFYILLGLFIYPFLSQCMHNWGPSRVGGPPGTTMVSDAEWGAIEQLCFGDVRLLGAGESTMLAAMELIGSLVIIVFAAWLVATAGLQFLERISPRGRLGRLGAPTPNASMRRRWTFMLTQSMGRIERLWNNPKRPVLAGVATGALLLTPLALSVPMIRGIFRLRDIQANVVDRMGSQYTGNEWGFGQIIGVGIFAPVITETAFEGWKHYRSLRRRRRVEERVPGAR